MMAIQGCGPTGVGCYLEWSDMFQFDKMRAPKNVVWVQYLFMVLLVIGHGDVQKV